jgi:hypothetical protein
LRLYILILTRYIDGTFSWLEDFIETERHGSEGVAEINTLASTHTLTIYPDTQKKVWYCGVDIQDGVLRILFAEEDLGVNNRNAFEHLAKALSAAASPASDVLDYAARNSIKQGWDEHVEKLQKDIADQLHNPDIKLNPNFEQVAQKLKASKNASKDWSQNLGNFAKEYFASVLSWMKDSKFEQDDLLYEGFDEQVTKNEIIFRIVDKVTGPSKYNQCLVEDGSFVLQTTPNYFGSNMSLIAEKLVDVL